jgi:hypothetical protein
MPSPPSLSDLQQWMRWVITHPAGVEQALHQPPLAELPARFQEPHPRQLGMVGGDARLGRELRLSVYASGYFDRLYASLQADHPRLEEALGPERFRQLVGHHLLARPSTSPSLADLGRGLDATLAGLPMAAEVPWSVDLARLERTQLEVWLTEAGGPAELPEPADADWAAVRLELTPTLRLLRTEWTVDLWVEEGSPPRNEPRRLAVWRTRASKGVVGLEPAAWEMLGALAAGATLDEACGRAEERGVTPEALLAEFSRWVQRGWIARTLATAAGHPGT